MSAVRANTLRRRETRTLGGLISIHESNYVRLQRLAPDLDRLDGVNVSRVAGALDLYLCVLDRFKYTTSLCLTYRFDASDEEDEQLFEPRARIMVYHDVRAVEVIGHCRRRASRKVHPWRRGATPELDRKWELNRFLHKWLGFCHRQGHLFLTATVQKVESSPTIFSSSPIS